MTGVYSATGILAALAHRERTGLGQYIDMALLDVQVATMANMNLNYLASGKLPQHAAAVGSAHPLSAGRAMRIERSRYRWAGSRRRDLSAAFAACGSKAAGPIPK
jgi:crotonobetainyl-CoA:carnitine CoA-transferase CaiB-like acyl-CoA transferase